MANAQALMNIDEELARIAAETSESLVATKGSYISTKGQIFTLPDSTPLSAVECIVVDFLRVNALMPPYNPKVHANPKCWALGRNDANLAPDDSVPDPKSALCATCEMNKFGSATNGGNGKACSNRYRLAIVPPNATTDSEIWLINVPPTSLTAWTTYLKKAEMSHGHAGFCRVVTKITLDPNVTYPKLIFKAISDVEDIATVLTLKRHAFDVLTASPSGD